jgi:hypothetical protein
MSGSISRLTLVIAALAGCAEPVRDGAVEALGPEAPGVPRGPLHRPGQPCVLCHSESGNAPPFSFAGTVFVDAETVTPIDDVSVTLRDLLGREVVATTNCAGNFFVRPRDFTQEGPVWVSMQRDEVFRDMNTPIYRDGSCAGCHDEPRGSASAGRVFLIEDPLVEGAPVSRCR